MAIRLSRNLLRNEGDTREEKFQRMQGRRSSLVKVAKDALEMLGYSLGASLKVPGGHAYRATFKGKSVKVGIKTSADRWVGASRDRKGEFGLLSKVDEVFIVAFNDWHRPTKIEMFKFDPQAILTVAKQAYSEADKHQQTGLKWFPLDKNAGQWRDTSQHNANLAAKGTKFFEDEIIWSESAEPQEGDKDGSSRTSLLEEMPIMEKIRTMLSKHMGVRPELIEIDVRVKI